MLGILRVIMALFVFASGGGSLSQTVEPSTTERQQPLPKRVTHARKADAGGQKSQLSVTETVKLTGIDTGMIVDTLECDTEGNFYLRNDIDFPSPIQKVNLKGEKKADFLASSATDLPNLPPQLAHSGRFSVTKDGDLYLEVMASMTEHDFLVFGKDGTYKSKVELENGSLWHVSKFALFDSGEFLITGEKWQKPEQNYTPFTAIFSPRGAFLKELSLEDDDRIYQYSVAGDSELVPHPGNNRAIWQGAMKTAADGNVYLMRWLSPAVVYAISPGGEVLRRFTVNPGDAGSMPSNMRIAGNSMAVDFRNKDTKKQLIKVVDLEGNEKASYEWPEFEGRTL